MSNKYDIFAIALVLFCWPIYWTVCRTVVLKQSFMIVASLAVVATLTKKSATLGFTLSSLLALMLMTALVYFSGKKLQQNGKFLYLLVSALVVVAAMFYIKLLQPVLPTLPPFGRIAVPLGISYYTFKQVHYLIDSSRGDIGDHNFLTFVNYVFFFPMFLAGPIERYQNFHAQSSDIGFDASKISMGIERILIGLCQKLIVSDLLISALLPPKPMLSDSMSTMQFGPLLFASFVKFFKVYFDFAGYTSIAIGVGLLFGLKLMENFNFPLLRPTLAEFWRNWHISLSSWARDYVYFPVLAKYRFASLALVCTMLTIGMWHSILPGWVFWGLHHGIGLSALSIYQKRVSGIQSLTRLRMSKPWRVGSTLAVWTYVSLGFALTFRPETVESSLTPYLRLITFGWLA